MDWLARAAGLTLAGVLLAGPAAAQTAGPLFQHRDWMAACDNAAVCRAVSVSPALVARQREADPGDLAEARLWVLRDPGPGAHAILVIDRAVFGEAQPVGPLSVHVVQGAGDGRLGQGFRLVETEPGRHQVAAQDAARFIAQTRAGTRLVTVRPDGTRHALISTDGMSAALRWIDARQGRAGSVTALVAAGPGVAAQVPEPRPRPEVRAVRGQRETGVGAPGTKDDTSRQAIVLACGLAAASPPADRAVTRFALANGQELLAVRCSPAAYAPAHWLVRTAPDRVQMFALPRPDSGEAGQPASLQGSTFDPDSGILTAVQLDRPAGDCGWQRRWVWTGGRFAMLDALIMPACAGLPRHQWLQTYRAVPQ
jgi:hypothetical protein